ncbi:unnamed protein product [Ranitomeya imitator]|uniref:Uncharacterized protein n=1 Tax=Ranitomeya imitator TaxID=111125 RepID=A0ABN9L6X7_9NEOB|nr:unnamed protein product [Ranitomeya imitator]
MEMGIEQWFRKRTLAQVRSKRAVLEGILEELGTMGSLINTMDVHILLSDLENIGYIGVKGVKIPKRLNQVLGKMVLNTTAVLGSSVSHLQDATLALIESEQESPVAKTCLDIQIEYSTNLKKIAQALQSGITPVGLMRNLPTEFNFVLNPTDLWVNKWLGCDQNICVGTYSTSTRPALPSPSVSSPIPCRLVENGHTIHDLVTPVSANKICFQVMSEKEVVSAFFSPCVQAESLTIGLYCIEGNVKTLTKKEGSINMTSTG